MDATRNYAQQTHQQGIEAERYSGANPPPSEEIAQSQIEVLTADVSVIETKLEHTKPDAYPRAEAYQEWRRRAVAALGYTKAEIAFLQKWLQKRKQTQKDHAKKTGGDALQVISLQIRERAKTLAQEITAEYVPLYDAQSPPPSILVAQARAEEIKVARLRLQGAFVEITAEWTKHPLCRDDMSGAKAPLQKILSRLEIEAAAVKAYLRGQATEMRSDWKAVCVKALTRACTRGFVLSPEEQIVYDELKRLVYPAG